MTRGRTRGSNLEVLFGRINSWSHASRSFFVLRLCCGILYAQAVGNFWTQDDVSFVPCGVLGGDACVLSSSRRVVSHARTQVVARAGQIGCLSLPRCVCVFGV